MSDHRRVGIWCISKLCGLYGVSIPIGLGVVVDLVNIIFAFGLEVGKSHVRFLSNGDVYTYPNGQVRT